MANDELRYRFSLTPEAQAIWARVLEADAAGDMAGADRIVAVYDASLNAYLAEHGQAPAAPAFDREVLEREIADDLLQIDSMRKEMRRLWEEFDHTFNRFRGNVRKMVGLD